MKNMISLIIFHIIGTFMYAVGAIWAIVSFVIFLVKDHPFDWRSIWLLVGGIVLAVLNFIISLSRKRNDFNDFRKHHRNFPR